MKSKWFLLLILALLLTACGQQIPGAAVPTAVEPTATQAPTLTPTPRPTRTPRPTATATTDPAQAAGEAAAASAKALFAALEAGDFEGAAGQLSSFGLMAAKITEGEAAVELARRAGESGGWSGFEVSGSRPMSEDTLLLEVSFKRGEQAVSELWPMRLELGAWRYNWNNLIDFRTLEVHSQSLNDITVKPVQVNRFSDKIQLVLIMQNRTRETFVFGKANEIVGTFHFGEQAVEAEQIQIILQPLHTAPDITLVAPGLYEAYPDSIEIRKWVNWQVPPWYVFELK